MIVVFYIAFCLIRYTTASLSPTTARIFLLFSISLLSLLYIHRNFLFNSWAVSRVLFSLLFSVTVFDVDLGFCPVLIPF